jgi:hypothetical protein
MHLCFHGVSRPGIADEGGGLWVWSVSGDIFKISSSGQAKMCGALVMKLTHYEMSRRISSSDSLACHE